MSRPIDRPDLGYATEYQWEQLANAVCTQAIRDYEWLISDRALPDAVTCAMCSTGELALFFKNQTLTHLPLEKIAEQIRRIYVDKFRPYVQENYMDICYSWISQNLDNKNKAYQKAHHPFKCPSCGDLLRPEKKTKKVQCEHILCCGCNLNMRLPEWFIKEINKEDVPLDANTMERMKTIYGKGDKDVLSRH